MLKIEIDLIVLNNNLSLFSNVYEKSDYNKSVLLTPMFRWYTNVWAYMVEKTLLKLVHTSIGNLDDLVFRSLTHLWESSVEWASGLGFNLGLANHFETYFEI